MTIHVCIITHNSEDTILNQISLLKKINPYKYFIFDNNSTDNTLKIIENNTNENIELIKHSNFCDPYLFFNQKVTFFLKNYITNCKYFLICNYNTIVNDAYINNFYINEQVMNYYGFIRSSNNLLIRVPFLLSCCDNWYIDNNNEIINISKQIPSIICINPPLYHIKSNFWDMSYPTDAHSFDIVNLIKDPANLFRICNTCILKKQIDQTLYYFHLLNYSLSIKKCDYKDNLYFLCYQIINLFLSERAYNKNIIIEISKIALNTIEQRAEIYHFLGLFFYSIQNYHLSLYFFENAIDKKLYEDFHNFDKIYPNAYKLEYNYLILISAFLSNNQTKLSKYLTIYKKYCFHIPNVNNIINLIEDSFIEL